MGTKCAESRLFNSGVDGLRVDKRALTCGVENVSMYHILRSVVDFLVLDQRSCLSIGVTSHREKLVLEPFDLAFGVLASAPFHILSGVRIQLG